MSSRLLIEERPLQVLPSLAREFGVVGAILLQQIHYWTQNPKNTNHFEGRAWVYNTYDQWNAQLNFCSCSTVRRTVSDLEALGILITPERRAPSNAKYYALDYDRLQQIFQPSGVSLSCEEDVTQSKKSVRTFLFGAASSLQERDLSPKPQPAQSEHSPVQNGQDKVLNLGSSYSKDTKTSLQRFSSFEDEEDFQGMVDLWNELVQSRLQKQPVRLTSERHQKLHLLMNEVFQGDLQRWQSYCEKIASCGYLMRKNPRFQVSFNWAIYDGITESQGQSPQKSPKKFLEDLEEHCALTYPQNRTLWFEMCQALLKCAGQSVFKAWFWEITPIQLEVPHVILGAKSLFTKDQLEQKYRSTLERAIQRTVPQYKFLSLVYDPKLNKKEEVPHEI